jgi:hypothetical protein
MPLKRLFRSRLSTKMGGGPPNHPADRIEELLP